MDAFKLPEGNVQIALSGGRTSAYMLYQILKANGDLPERVKVLFQNTGREMPQTLDFVKEIGERWSVDIIWLEYQSAEPLFRAVDYASASREGEPFEALIATRAYLPNQRARYCTAELKERTATRYLKALGWQKWSSAVGIRADEPHRIGKTRKERWTQWTPLATANVSRKDVAAFWKGRNFDLQLPNVGGNCWLGNCDGCFLKSEANIAALTRDYPERANWWERMEASKHGHTTSKQAAQFSERYSRADLREYLSRQGDWIFSDKGSFCQASSGECF
ncbi:MULTISPECIES: phosphoadenosine phosphosulfate reductase family protein [unclassified Pseudovibrio]|uniref:phosphoadenosine phosphosulfate reductase domain-containing protein n=1 Tax=unclassified Pseudovibrio TaxID=2627060 RepID=UPI0007AEBD57|nr:MULTISPECIES: phosphoadenosine phosphosulfate reductase family protein [unclassified Pseudovibrio]KZK92540.1 Phosphoadenosine phosphosulfate reductase family protein [Pseudovibrio sp. W74]KZL03197.1 Phosphoadenosine phosphosulfate reductase family protein [Pseudovibrio sp. Ad14]